MVPATRTTIIEKLDISLLRNRLANFLLSREAQFPPRGAALLGLVSQVRCCLPPYFPFLPILAELGVQLAAQPLQLRLRDSSIASVVPPVVSLSSLPPESSSYPSLTDPNGQNLRAEVLAPKAPAGARFLGSRKTLGFLGTAAAYCPPFCSSPLNKKNHEVLYRLTSVAYTHD